MNLFLISIKKSVLSNLFFLFALATFLSCGEQEVPEPEAPQPEMYVSSKPTIAMESPEIQFTDITHAAGIHFVHENGYSGQKFMPETMGSGGGFFDYDNDGDLDVFLVNSRYFDPDHQDQPPTYCALYQNDGSGQFIDVTEQAGLKISLYGMGCVMADVDGDGDQDLFITAAIDGNRFYRNNGDGTFTDATAESGLTSPKWSDGEGKEHDYWSTSAAFFDYDLDGQLDLIVCNYIEWSMNNDIFTTRDGIGKSFTTPDLYKGQTSLLYRNRGDGTFENVTESAGVYNPHGKSLGVAVFDFNQDNYPDFVIANDSQPNALYINQQDGTFIDMALIAGVGYDENGRARAGMGIDVAEWDGKRPAIAIGNFSHEPISLYSMENDLFFVDAAGRAQISRPSLISLTFGLVFFDYDLDGYLDMAIANGHIEPDIQKVEKEVAFKQRPQLFHNQAGKKFQEVTKKAGSGFVEPLVGRGLAYGDIDGDGDLDLLITNCGGEPRLLRNDNASQLHRFIRLKLEGKSPNTDAIGAKISLTACGITQNRMVRTGSSYLSQNELTLTFGLGVSDTIDELAIVWPRGQQQYFSAEELSRLQINTTHVIKEP